MSGVTIIASVPEGSGDEKELLAGQATAVTRALVENKSHGLWVWGMKKELPLTGQATVINNMGHRSVALPGCQPPGLWVWGTGKLPFGEILCIRSSEKLEFAPMVARHQQLRSWPQSTNTTSTPQPRLPTAWNVSQQPPQPQSHIRSSGPPSWPKSCTAPGILWTEAPWKLRAAQHRAPACQAVEVEGCTSTLDGKGILTALAPWTVTPAH